MNIFNFLDNYKLHYLSEKRDIKKDVVFLATEIRSNKLRWIDDVTEKETLFDDEDKKKLALDMIKTFEHNIIQVIKPDGSLYDPSEFLNWHWNTAPDSPFLLLWRIELRKEVKQIERENSYNKCCFDAIEEFKNINGYYPTAESVLERLRHKSPQGYTVLFTEDGVSIDGSTPKKEEKLIRSIRKLLKDHFII